MKGFRFELATSADDATTTARAFYEHHGFTVLEISDGCRNMENLPDMTFRRAPDSAR